MNGLTGKKMKNIFETLVPLTVYSDARNLVEYSCFRFLSRDGSDVHPSLQVYNDVLSTKSNLLDFFVLLFQLVIQNIVILNKLYSVIT